MRAEICTKQATFTLERLHAELAGKIQENKEEAERLANDMRHVEAVLKMLNPSYRVQAIAVRRRKPNQFFKRGTVFRRAIDEMRKAARPMTPREIALAMFATIGIPEPAHDDLKGITESVLCSLRNNEGETVQAIEGPRPVRWELV
jgi:hypothetical protein